MLKYIVNNKVYTNRRECKKDIGLWRYKCANKNGQIIYINEDKR